MRDEEIQKRRRLLLAAPAVILAVVLLGLGGQWLENRSRKPEARGDHHQRRAYDESVQIDGVSYRKRGNVTTILLMGIDQDSDAQGGARDGGQADFLRLLVVDSSARKITQVAIDRDTMTPITILGVLGDRSGMRTAQISLSHGFGGGKEESCELTVEAVSNLLYDAPIDFYIAMNLDGIPALNDSVGGVTVTLEDDFSAIDPAMTPGTTLTLMGDQAEVYVRSRMSIGVGTNESRMNRQELYISQLMSKLDDRLREDKAVAGEFYDLLEPYLTTDCGRGRLINEVWLAKDYERGETIRPEGTHKVGSDGFMQFEIDEDRLKQIVLELFYEPI